MATEKFKRKLTAVFSADVAGYSRLMSADEATTVETLTTYREIMASLIKQHRRRGGEIPLRYPTHQEWNALKVMIALC